MEIWTCEHCKHGHFAKINSIHPDQIRSDVSLTLFIRKLPTKLWNFYLWTYGISFGLGGRCISIQPLTPNCLNSAFQAHLPSLPSTNCINLKINLPPLLRSFHIEKQSQVLKIQWWIIYHPRILIWWISWANQTIKGWTFASFSIYPSWKDTLIETHPIHPVPWEVWAACRASAGCAAWMHCRFPSTAAMAALMAALDALAAANDARTWPFKDRGSHQ